MKRLLPLIIAVAVCLIMSGNAFAVDKTAQIAWEQDCITGCTLAVDGVDAGPIGGWRIYMADTPGGYGAIPIVDLPYTGIPAPSYTSNYILTLTGAGTKYFIVRSYSTDTVPIESGDSNEVNYPYNFAGTAIPVSVTFMISN